MVEFFLKWFLCFLCFVSFMWNAEHLESVFFKREHLTKLRSEYIGDIFMNIPVHRTHWRSPLSIVGAAPYTSVARWHQRAWCTSGTLAIDHSHWSNQYKTLLHPLPKELERCFCQKKDILCYFRKRPLQKKNEKSLQ